VAQKPRDAVVNFFYRNLQRHRAVLPAIARLLFFRALSKYFKQRRLSPLP